MLTIKEVADQLGVHEMTVRQWIADGLLPAVRLPGGKAIRVRRDDLDSHLVDIQPKTAADV